MSEPAEPTIVVPEGREGGVFANHVAVFADIEHVTIDFARLDPREPTVGFLVARVTAPTSCILVLRRSMEHVT